MPYKSEAQRRKFHQMLNEKKISKTVVNEFDKSSKGLVLPEKVGKAKVKTLKELKELAKKKLSKK